MAEYAQYSEVSPQWTQFVASQPLLTDLDRVGIVERKRIFGEIEAQIPVRKVPDDVTERTVTVTEFTIPARDGYPIPVRSYFPAGARPNASLRPLLVYLHAGGFLFGDLNSGDLNCRVLALRLNISVLNVGYRLAPKWPFPYGVNDSYDATAWAARNAEAHLAASPNTGFLVGGISSGANFAGVIAYMARDAGLSPPITGLFISIPVCIMPQAYAAAPSEWTEKHLLSLEQNAENPLLTRKSLMDIQELYGCPPEDPRISFLLNKDHTGLPGRAYFQICGRDPLRDEAFLWQKLLAEYSGTKSKIHLYSGQPHGFWRFLQMEISQRWLDDVVEGIAFLIKGEEPVQQTELIIKL
ncbi:Alpha/Beta hydrolase protein [Aspergillus similis]